MKSIADTVKSITRLSAILIAVSLVAGCASVASTRDAASAASADTLRNPERLSRAERVFLYQSRVADALLDEYPLFEVFENADPVLIEAEARMTESCSPLTQAVLSHFEGTRPSLGLRFRVMTTIGECERAARAIDRLLNGSAQTGAI